MCAKIGAAAGVYFRAYNARGSGAVRVSPAARTAAITAEAKGMSAMCRRFFFEPPFMHSRLPYKSNHGPIFTHAASFGHMYLATL